MDRFPGGIFRPSGSLLCRRALLGGFFYGMTWATWRYPSVLNLPSQEAYRSLPESDQ